MRIGISGGTFDPIHIGHLIIAEGVRVLFSLDKILFIPAGIPPHKDARSISSAFHRLKMVEKAIEGNSYFEVSDVEVKRTGLTYTIDTLRELYQPKGNKFYYIIGADTLFNILSWKNVEEIFKICAFVVVFRPSYAKEKVLEQIQWLKKNFTIEIESVDLPQVDVSSSYIRESFKEDKMIKYFIPKSVEEYMIANKLYR